MCCLKIFHQFQKRPHNLILTGPSGSGKTLLMSEAFRQKVAECKDAHQDIRIIIATHCPDTNRLKEDYRYKYNLDSIMSDYHVEPVSLIDLMDGKCFYQKAFQSKKILSCFSEFDIDDYDPEDVCSGINHLITQLHQRNNGFQKLYWIIFLDEIQIWGKNSDFSNLKLHYEDVSFFGAINPIAQTSDKYDCTLPNNDGNTMCERLNQKHRNSTEISIFLLHFVKYFNSDTPYKTIDDSSLDTSVLDSTFRSHLLPVLVTVSETLVPDTDSEVFGVLRENILFDNNDVTLICDDRIKEDDEPRSQTIQDLCKSNGWKFAGYCDMWGTEASIIIVYYCQLYGYAAEMFTRARKQLVIVERYVSFFPFFYFQL